MHGRMLAHSNALTPQGACTKRKRKAPAQEHVHALRAHVRTHAKHNTVADMNFALPRASTGSK
eukprot:5954497-Alexandrium_andersonii.AAC.1